MNLICKDPWKELVKKSNELKQMRLSSEYLEQMRKNDELLTIIEKDWKAFTIAFDEAKNNSIKSKSKNEKIEVPAAKIDNNLLDFEKSFKTIKATNKKNIVAEITTKENDCEYEFDF